MSITENVRMARQKINAAAESAGRSGSEVRLLAATKMNGPEAVQEAIRAGVDICAENRVQEFLSKNAVNAYAPCCPPAVSAGEENRWYFRQMYELFVDIRRKTYDNVTMAELSMGMSGDYEEAVRCGATIVRLGTALFGPRNYDLQEAPPYGTIG